MKFVNASFNERSHLTKSADLNEEQPVCYLERHIWKGTCSKVLDYIINTSALWSEFQTDWFGKRYQLAKKKNAQFLRAEANF